MEKPHAIFTRNTTKVVGLLSVLTEILHYKALPFADTSELGLQQGTCKVYPTQSMADHQKDCKAEYLLDQASNQIITIKVAIPTLSLESQGYIQTPPTRTEPVVHQSMRRNHCLKIVTTQTETPPKPLFLQRGLFGHYSTHPCRVATHRREVRTSRASHGHVGVQPGAQHAGQERNVSAVAVAGISPVMKGNGTMSIRGIRLSGAK